MSHGKSSIVPGLAGNCPSFIRILALLCVKIQAHQSKWAQGLASQKFRDALFMSRISWWLSGAMCGFALLAEEKRRRAELAMYVLPRGLESAWCMLKGKGWLPIIPGGESLLCSLGMGMIMVSLLTLDKKTRLLHALVFGDPCRALIKYVLLFSSRSPH